MCTLLIAGAAIVALGRLQADATTSRDGERQLVTLRLDMSQIQYVPWGAAPGEDDPASVAGELTGDQQSNRR